MSAAENGMTAEEVKMASDLRLRGFAVAIFNPDELAGAKPSNVEDLMVERGWDAIETLKADA